jgi:hypothetical protein
MINFRTLTVDDVIALLNISGLITSAEELQIAGKTYFKYVGCKKGSAQYLIAGEAEDVFYVSRIHVSIGQDKLGADFSGSPEFETRDLWALNKYFNEKCQ